jgi:hypothetical protein
MYRQKKRTTVACALLVAAMGTGRAFAQEQAPARVSLDSVISIDAFQGQATVDDPNIVVDVTAVFRLADGWLVYLRPWFREPRLPHPQNPSNWDKEIYQAAVQYQRTGRVSTRVDAGYIVSPIGLGMMDTRPGINPTIAPHLSYVQPIPAFEGGAPRVGVIAASYPLGTQLTLSTTKWDARAAVVNSAPTRAYVIGRENNPRSTPVVITGAGLTPMSGLRVGAAFATGVYVRGEELTVPSEQDRDFRMFNVEGDFAFGYTRISGEVTQTRFAAVVGAATARGWFVQGTHTLSPRWFVAARQEGVSAPPLVTAATSGSRRTFHASETTVGYRLSRDLTLRSSFMARKAYTRTEWDQQVGLSVVWARRWW